MHISRVFNFSRDARKMDPFLARNCEKCEKGYVPIFGHFVAGFGQKLKIFKAKQPYIQLENSMYTKKYSYFLNFQSFAPLPIVLLQNNVE